MKKHHLMLAIAAISTLSGCATVIKGSDQALTFNSEPDGAQVIVDGRLIGVTPLTAKVKKNSADTVMIKKDGYKTQTMPLDKKYDGVALLSVFWDLSTTDIATGAAFEYVPNSYHFQLKKEEASAGK